MRTSRSRWTSTIRERARFWHILLVVAVVVGIEILFALPGAATIAVYVVAFVAVVGILAAVFGREGPTVLQRSDTHHGNDMHGHY